MSNTLLSPAMILAKAMFLVWDAEKENDEPFEAAAEFTFPSVALIDHLDAFSEQYIRPAVAAALHHKRPLAEWQAFECDGSDMQCSGTYAGIAGHFVRYYDIARDALPTRIEIRAADGPTRREAMRRLEERWEARRRSRYASA